MREKTQFFSLPTFIQAIVQDAYSKRIAEMIFAKARDALDIPTQNAALTDVEVAIQLSLTKMEKRSSAKKSRV